MEEQFLPVFAMLPLGSRLQPVSVFRPYHLRWDTVYVGVQRVGTLTVVSLWTSKTEHELVVIGPSGALLWVRRTDMDSDRHPLEYSRRYQEYERALPALEQLLLAYR